MYMPKIQRADEGAGARRARYNSAMMDADETVTGMDTELLPETYVIFITENDIYGKNQPRYEIERYIDGIIPFNDGTHIIYVNGKYRGNHPIGDLMHDFSCKKSVEMKNSILADKIRQMKESEQGVQNMCKIMEDFAIEEKIGQLVQMLEEGIITEESLSRYTGVTPEQIRKVLELYHNSVVVKA